MKKTMFLLISVFSAFSSIAQNVVTLTDGKPVFVYSLPKTEFHIEVEIEKTTQKPGIFYQFSERYLATSEVVTEEKTSYRLKTITIKPVAVPDPKRTYQIESEGGIRSYITVDESGILCGVNVSSPEVTAKKQLIKKEFKDSPSKSLLPLGEEYLMAGSTAKLAEGAAKQIYRIRESRMALLSGDMDKLPSDGKAFNSMLIGLDKSELELTNLFTGKVIVENQFTTLKITPDSPLKSQVLFRISTLRGLVDSADLSGAPYYINFDAEIIQKVPPAPKSKLQKTSLNTILPASTQVSISDGIKIYVSDYFYVPQFGEIVPVSANVFNTPRMKIKIDKETGRLIGIEK